MFLKSIDMFLKCSWIVLEFSFQKSLANQFKYNIILYFMSLSLKKIYNITRLGEEEEDRRVVTTCLLPSTASG